MLKRNDKKVFELDIFLSECDRSNQMRLMSVSESGNEGHCDKCSDDYVNAIDKMPAICTLSMLLRCERKNIHSTKQQCYTACSIDGDAFPFRLIRAARLT